jgi:hypothetical protein
MKIPCLTLSLTVVGPFGHTPIEMQKYSKSAEGKVLLKLSIPQALSVLLLKLQSYLTWA